MLAKIYSAAVYGVGAYEVEIEVNAGAGEVKMVIVGLPDAAVKESRDRVRTAIANSSYRWSRKRTTINLAPADIKKEGPSFDLPIALGMIAVAEELNTSAFEKFSFVGELALDGSVRPVKGVLPVALEARRRGKQALFVPQANALEAAIVGKIDIYACTICDRLSNFCAANCRCSQPRAISPVFLQPTKPTVSILPM